MKTGNTERGRDRRCQSCRPLARLLEALAWGRIVPGDDRSFERHCREFARKMPRSDHIRGIRPYPQFFIVRPYARPGSLFFAIVASTDYDWRMNRDSASASLPSASFAPQMAPAHPDADTGRLPLEPMDPQITSIQPGGGVVVRLELAWGYVRRAYLKWCRPGYVARMAALRRGTKNACPFEVLDPRDVKFFRNQEGYWWASDDDPFAWRERLPFARVGLAELWLISGAFFGIAGGCAWGAIRIHPLFCGGTAIAFFLGACIVWFFRNPRRPIPQEPGLVVSPADGKIVHVEELPHDDFIGGPAVLIGIFLSVFNVHINRTPVAARVIGLHYRKGKFLNALRPESARENEQLAVRIEATRAPYRRMVVRQITGAIARRIVCWIKPGDELAAGEQFGMIKLGSRTELVFPREKGLEIVARMGQTVKAGTSVLARYTGDDAR
jgi:phosphatidylserine decarboxylase